MSQTIIIKIQGMSCTSCELWLEDSLSQIDGIIKVNASLSSNTVKLKIDENINIDELIDKINFKINNRKYIASLMDKEVSANNNLSKKFDFNMWLNVAIISTIILSIYFVLERSKFVNVIGSDINYFSIFVIGLVASISTCGSTVGSIVLGLSASLKKNNQNPRKIYLFHISRFITFLIFGGILGFIGQSLSFNLIVENIIRVLLQIILLILALNLLGFKFFSKLLPRLPKSISSNTFKYSKINSNIIPFALGVLTFFLPCGFTQSIQLLALKSGSIASGSLIMTIFVLGTMPMMLGITKITEVVSSEKTKEVFFKVAGIIVLIFSIRELFFLLK